MFCIACGSKLDTYVQPILARRVIMGTCYREGCPLKGYTLSEQSFLMMRYSADLRRTYRVIAAFDPLTGQRIGE